MNKKFLINEKEISKGPLYIDLETDSKELEIKSVEIPGKIHVKGVIKKVSKRIFFEGEVRFQAHLICSLCGEEFSRDFTERIYVEFVKGYPTVSEKPIKLHVDELDVEYYPGEVFSIESSIHDTIILAIPFAPKCREDCKGLCPVCGTNLNREQCNCNIEKTNPLKEQLLKLKK